MSDIVFRHSNECGSSEFYRLGSAVIIFNDMTDGMKIVTKNTKILLNQSNVMIVVYTNILIDMATKVRRSALHGFWCPKIRMSFICELKKTVWEAV